MSRAEIASQVFSHYHIRARLGEDGLSDVVEAWDSKLCRSVAIKRLPGLANPLQTAGLASSLRHAAFVKIFAIEEDGTESAIVMELVRGCSLQQWSQNKAQHPRIVLEIIHQIALAMSEAHDANLVHGDLRPSTLIREPDGTLRILDFGFDSQLDPQVTVSRRQLDPLGSIVYMAPELLLGAQSSQASDIYALGVILYQLLCGHRPHAHLNGNALAAAHVQTDSASWDYPDDWPSAMKHPLTQLILDMTARSPKERISSMHAISLQTVALKLALAQPSPMSHRRIFSLCERWFARFIRQ